MADQLTNLEIAMVRVEAKLGSNTELLESIIPHVEKIPLMELSLTNHLHSHDNFKKYVTYPLLVAFVLGAGATLWKVVIPLLK